MSDEEREAHDSVMAANYDAELALKKVIASLEAARLQYEERRVGTHVRDVQ